MRPDRARTASLPALVAGNVLGFSGTTAVPLWLAARAKDDAAAGLVASGEIAAIALAALAATALMDRIGARRLCLTAALASLLANLLALVPLDAAFFVGRLGSGAAVGAVLASVTSLAARRPDSQRVMATMQIGLAAYALAFYLGLPGLVEQVGAPAVFAAQAATALLAFVFMAVGLFGQASPRGAASNFRPSGAAILVLLGLVAVFAGQSMAWNSIFALGEAKGFGLRQVGAVMAACGGFTIAGPVVARMLGERVGLRPPVVAFGALLALDALLIALTGQFWVFAVATVALVLLPGFGLPYVFTLAGRVGDASHAGAAPAFLMFGSALGPALASPLVAGGAWSRFGLVAAGACLLGALLMGAARARSR